MEIFNKKILLCSRSPRRKQILEEMGFAIKVVSSDCKETYPQELLPTEIPVFLARKKAQAYTQNIAINEILLAADTIVVNDNCILGKPENEQEAFQMLKNLSDKQHTVITGCFLQSNTSSIGFYEQTNVSFAKLTDEEIKYYISKKQPFDKAGAYGIQEWIGMIGIKAIIGDYYNVMGLPAHKLWQQIKLLK